MRAFINTASFEAQASNVQHGGRLLVTMMEAVEELLTIGVSQQSLYRDDLIHNCTVVPGLSFNQLTTAQYKQIKQDEEAAIQEQVARGAAPTPPATASRFSKFLRYLTDSPLASEAFAEAQFTCEHAGDDVSYRAAGYTAHFSQQVFEGTRSTAVTVSLSEHPRYRDEELNVLYQNDSTLEERWIWNIAHPDQIIAARRWYDHNAKHPPDADIRDFVSAMDLPPAEAQRVLDQAVALEGERRVFARYNGFIYIFPCHYQRNPQHPTGKSLYHGFRVANPRTMRSRMVDVCNQLVRHVGWKELRP